MDAKYINQLPIGKYLEYLNIYPVKDRGYYGMYHSPFREDSNASMKVDYNKNLWIDFGSNNGGTLIDLVMLIKNCSNGEAMQLLEQHIAGIPSFSFQGNNSTSLTNHKEQKQKIIIQQVIPLMNPALLAYIKERGVNIEIAKQHCSEVHYMVNDKPYFALGYKNDNGGYELRNKYFKGCTSKDITSIQTGRDTCQLFEGFMDYLTFLTIKNCQKSPVDVIVLNSLSNLPKVQNTLSAYRQVSTFLDNDEAGKRAVEDIKKVCKNVNDQAFHYSNHKDLNEYFCFRLKQKHAVKESPAIRTEFKKKPNRGLKF